MVILGGASHWGNGLYPQLHLEYPHGSDSWDAHPSTDDLSRFMEVIYIYKTPPIIIHYWWLLVINSYHIIDGYTMVIPMMQAWDCLRELSLSPPHCPLRIFGRLLPGHAEQVQLQRLLQPRKGDQGGGARELHVPGEEGNGDAWFGERLGLRLGYFPKWPQNDHFSREKMGKGVISYFQTPKGRARLGWFAIGWESTMGVGVCVFHVIM